MENIEGNLYYKKREREIRERRERRERKRRREEREGERDVHLIFALA